MAKHGKFVITVDRNSTRPKEWSDSIALSTYTGTRKLAADMREKVKQRFLSSIHKTPYMYTSHPKQSGADILNKIVVSEEPRASGMMIQYTVGAKKGATINGQPAEDVLFYMDKGTGKHNSGRSDSWTFRMPDNRGGELLTTYGQKPKLFMTDTAKEFETNLTAYSKVYVQELMEKHLQAQLARKKGGIL